MKRTLLPLLVLLAQFGFGSGDARGQDGEPSDGPVVDEPIPVSFHRDVLPILQAKCHGCHQPARNEGDLVLTSHARMIVGGRSGDTVVPGKPDESLLIDEVIPWDDEPPTMPPEGEPLTDAQVDVLRRWIEQGAHDDTPAALGPVVDPDHPPVYRQAPVITGLAYSPDGKLLAVTGYHEVLLHRADGGALLGRLIGLSERVESVAFSADGKWLAVAGGSPGRTGELQIWNVETRKLRLSVPVTHDTIYGASWTPDGTRVAFGCADNTLRAVDAKTGAEVLFQGAHNDWVLDTVFSSDASHLVSVSRDHSMKLTKVETQQFIDNITSITPGALKGGLIAVDRHPLRDELVVGGADGEPKIFKMYREKKRVIGDDYNLIRTLEAMAGRVFDVSYSPDGTRVAAGSSHGMGGQVRVYAAEDGAVVGTHDVAAGVFAVAFHPSEPRIAAGGFDGRVRILDAANAQLVHEFVPVTLQTDDGSVSE